MSNRPSSKYHDEIKRSTLKLLHKIFKVSIKTGLVLKEYFNESEYDQLEDEITKEFERILPNIPYIGGKKNGLTKNLAGSALYLAFIKVLERKGFDSREIGKVCYELSELYYNSLPKFLKLIMRKFMFSKRAKKKGKKKSLKLQQKQYEENWVSKFLDGEGEDYDLGIEYSECGICKLYEKLGAMNYMPYLCILDYASFGSFGIMMKRTQTIGNGADTCDFRFYKKGVPQRGWPPDKLEEFNQLIIEGKKR